jgi:signal transduction histidine kinase
MMTAPAEGYAGLIATRIDGERFSLAAAWLARLREILSVTANEVFPSDQLLDHIPALIAEIGRSLGAVADGEIAANTAVMEKARELGLLRHQQHATAHQLLHEYEILSEILEAFVVDETAKLEFRPEALDCFALMRRLTHAVRVLMRTTIDTFISEYTATIQDQNDRIKAFNRAASHELRSPIGTLLFAGTLLGTDAVREDPQRLAKVASAVRTNAERLSWLVENLQRIARIGEPLDVPSVQRVDVGSLALEVARQLEEMASARNVLIRIEPPLPELHADPARLELILLNLVSNAVKYSDPIKPQPLCEILAGGEAEAGTCTICVRDNGIGIPDADQPAIFDRFFRAHAHLDASLGVTGTGLGLAIVIDCVRALGGSIRCESKTGEGTSFFITLPTGTPAATN